VQPRDTDLLFDEVEIIYKPFGGRRDVPALGRGPGHKIVDLAELALVLFESLEQRVPPASRIDLLPLRQFAGMIAQLLEVQQLVAEWWVVHSGPERSAPGSAVGFQSADSQYLGLS